VAEIAAGLTVSRPAVSQHLKILRDSDLVHERREGNRRFYRANPLALTELGGIIEKMRRTALAVTPTTVAPLPDSAGLREEAAVFKRAFISGRRDRVDDRIDALQKECAISDAQTFGVLARITYLDITMRRFSDTSTNGFGLRWGDAHILTELICRHPPYESTPATLRRQLQITLPGVLKHIARLEKLGFVEKVRDRQGAIGALIRLTPIGSGIAQKLIAQWTSNSPLSPILRLLPKSDILEINRILRELILLLE
jgi:DNA-binding MarR family transcriptional regulator